MPNPSEEAPKDWYNIIGYSKLGDRVMRVDMVERLLALIRIAARDGSFKITEEMLSIAGASKEQMSKVLIDLDFELLDKDKIDNHVIDTLTLARDKFPGSSISLDALCKKYLFSLLLKRLVPSLSIKLDHTYLLLIFLPFHIGICFPPTTQ